MNTNRTPVTPAGIFSHLDAEQAVSETLRFERFPCGCEGEHSSDPVAYEAFVAAGGEYARCEKYRSIIARWETGGEPWSRIGPLLNEHFPRRLKGAVVELAVNGDGQWMT